LFLIGISLLAVDLPAHWILPVKIETIEVVFLQEFNDMSDELRASCWVPHESTVFVTSRIIPASDSESHLNSLAFELHDSLVEFVVDVSPRVMSANCKLVVVENGKTVDDVRA
jgi:hypothetical protein